MNTACPLREARGFGSYLCPMAVRVRDCCSSRGRSLRRERACGAPTVQVSGTVTDGSGHGWPLYARIEFTSPSTDPVVAYSDPVTGQYAANVADATTHTVAVTTVRPGYAAGGGTVVTAGAPLDADWTLIAAAVCDAPGYTAPAHSGRRFSPRASMAASIPPGWTVQTNSGGDWKVVTGADPCGFFEGNQTGGSGPVRDRQQHTAAFFEDTYLVTPTMDLSSRRERRDPLGQRLPRRRLRRHSPRWRSRSTAARPGRTSGRLRRGALRARAP